MAQLPGKGQRVVAGRVKRRVKVIGSGLRNFDRCNRIDIRIARVSGSP